MRSLRVFALAAALGACFADEGGGVSGGTTGPECLTGSNGCPCYGNGTCDQGFECSMGACIVPGCTPGGRDCNCVEGECLGVLVCEEGACHDPPPVASEGSGMSGTTSIEETTAGPGTSAADGAESITTSLPTDTGPPLCEDAGDCTTCRDCATFGPCYAEYVQCQRDPLCNALMLCVMMCADGDNTCAMDCAFTNMGGEVLFGPLASCVSCMCAAQCMSSC